MNYYVADFETTTKPEDCHVWAYAICDVANVDNISIGTTIDDFMKWCMRPKENPVVYFHNMGWDLQFIIFWLLTHGYEHVSEKTDKADKTFTTIISSLGVFYSCEVIFKKAGKKVNKVTFLNSQNLFNMKVEKIAKTYKMPYRKGKIDYKAHDNLPVGSPLSDNEIEYIKNDVRIVAHAIHLLHEQGHNKMTIGACALEDYKNILGKKEFNRFFPEPLFHEDVQRTLKGGWTWLNPPYANKIVKNGIVLDVNGLHSDKMYNELLPYGKAIYFEGEYEPDDYYPLYTQKFRCQFELKPGKIPMVQIKEKNSPFSSVEYLTSSNDEEVTLCMTSVDLEVFKEHYNIYNPEYISGYKFKGSTSFFKGYIDKWVAIKQKAKEEKNWGLYLIAKIFLNSLFGKFGTDNKGKSKIPYLEDGIVKYKTTEWQSKNAIYVAVASFITAYARRTTITAAQKIMDRHNEGLKHGLKLAQFIYSDTDSLHIELQDETIESFLEECGLDIDSQRLGAWDHEATFSEAKFIRAKCYIEKHILTEEKYNEQLLENEDESYLYSKDENGYYFMKITVAGMPSDCYKHVTMDNFEIGATYAGKKTPTIVQGGVILEDVNFTIKK